MADKQPPKLYSQQEYDDRARRVQRHERERQQQIINAGVARVDPLPHLTSTVLATAPDIWQHFKVVPDRFYNREGKTAVFVCPCGWHEPDDEALNQARLELGDLYECPGCLRVYFMGARLHAAAGAEAPGIEHSHPYEQPCAPPCPEFA